MEIIIHIGQSKAGSSAIQKALADNKDILSKNRAIYPEEGRCGFDAHYSLKDEIIQGDFSCLRECIKKYCDYDKMVFSCEGFWLYDDQLVELLAKELEGRKVTIILYLRALESYLESSWRQAVKFRGSKESFIEHAHRIEAKLSYSDLLARWGQRFSLKVSSYDCVRHQLLDDFFTRLGVDAHNLKVNGKAVNVTPCDGAIRMMRLVNFILPPKAAKSMRVRILDHQSLFSILPSYDRSKHYEAYQRVKSSWDREMLEKFLDSNDLKYIL